jgi:hypothetical protein
MVGTVGNKGLKAHRYGTDTSVSVSFCSLFFGFKQQKQKVAQGKSRAFARVSRMN